MKRFAFILTVALLAPLAAHAQERMGDSEYVAATRCIAYAEHRALASDAPNVEALRQAVRQSTSRMSPVILGRADSAEDRIKRMRARNDERLQELRDGRSRACAPFAAQGLVQMETAATAS
jgi:hypothetical protein